jgi:hypothetical protein
LTEFLIHKDTDIKAVLRGREDDNFLKKQLYITANTGV